MSHAEVTLPGQTSSVPTARRFVESLLASWGEPDLGWSAAVCVSELAANCALHARTEFTVRVELSGDACRLDITDGSLRVPSPRDYGASATTGRGLRMVEEYAQSWGVDVGAQGKTVWVLLVAPRPGGREDTAEDAEPSVDALLARFSDGTGEADGSTARSAWPEAA